MVGTLDMLLDNYVRFAFFCAHGTRELLLGGRAIQRTTLCVLRESQALGVDLYVFYEGLKLWEAHLYVFLHVGEALGGHNA